MACNCNSHVAGGEDPNAPPKKPCGPCAAAVKAMAVAPIRLGAAADDLTVLQQFLQQLSSTQTFPTNAELSAAQQAATNLSTELPGVQGAPAGQGSTMTLSPARVIVMVAGAALLGGSVVALVTSKKRKRR